MLILASPTSAGEPLSVASSLREKKSVVSLSRLRWSSSVTVELEAWRENISLSAALTASEKSMRALDPSSASVA